MWNRGSRTVDEDVLIHKLFSKVDEPHTTQTLSPILEPSASLPSGLYSHRETSPNQATFTPISDNSQENPAVPCTRDWDLGSSYEPNEEKRSASTKKQQQQQQKKHHWKQYSTKCEHNDNNFYRYTNTQTRYVPVLSKSTKYNTISLSNIILYVLLYLYPKSFQFHFGVVLLVGFFLGFFFSLSRFQFTFKGWYAQRNRKLVST